MDTPAELRTWFESLLRNAPEGYLLVTEEGRIRWANPAALVLFDVDESSLADCAVERWIPSFPPDLSACTDLEIEGVTAKSDRIPLEIGVTPVDDGSGHAWVVVRDIQRRKGLEGSVRLHAEELERNLRARARELEEARERQARFSEAAPVLDFELDSQGTIASAGRKACLTLGVAADRIVGLSLEELVLPSGKETFRAAFAGFLGGSATPFEARLRGAQGGEVDILFHPCCTEKGGRRQLRLVGLDVSARREAERLVEQGLQLAESQRARMEAFLRGIAEPVVVTDPDGQVRLMNHPAEFSLGIDEPLAFGRDLLSEQLDSRFVEEWRGFLHGQEDTHRAELIWGEGARTFEVTMSRVRTKAGRLAGCVCILRNVTLDRQERQQKQRFLANVTYELRASLKTIRSQVTGVAQDGGVTSAESHRRLVGIEREAARLSGRISDLLALMRLDAGQDPVECRPANLVRILEDVRAGWAKTAAQRNVALELQAGIEGDGVFDGEKVRRAVDRLVSNAFRFTPRGGRIEIRADRDGDRFELAVADSGRGMDEETLQRVLDPFSTPSGGTLSGTPGLGVQLVRRLITVHEGELTAESRVGAGTTYRLRVPVVPAEARAPEGPGEEQLPPGDPLRDDPDPVEAEQD